MSSTSPLGGLENRTMLAKFKVGKWSPSVADAKATKIIEDAKPETNEEDEAELTAQEELGGSARAQGESKKPRKAGKFRKWLIDVENPLWQAIINAEGRGRKVHKTLTLRWVVDGAGVLPAQATTSYRTTINRIRDDFFTAVDAFVAGLPALIAERRQALEPIGLFCEDDYPSGEKIRQQFSFKYEIHPMPAAMVSEELLNQLSEEDRQEILPLIGDGSASVMQIMENDLLERVAETVGRMAERLANPTAVFRDSLVENLRGLATTLGDLNVLNNQEIATIREQINQSLLVDPQSLRDDPTLRAQTAAVATEIAATAVRRIRSLAAPPAPSVAPTEEEIAERQQGLEEGLAIVRGESVVEAAVQTPGWSAQDEADYQDTSTLSQISQTTADSLAHIREGLDVHAGHLAPEFVDGMRAAADRFEERQSQNETIENVCVHEVRGWCDQCDEEWRNEHAERERSTNEPGSELAASPSAQSVPRLFD